MAFEFKELDIDGVYLIKPHIFMDTRGEYMKYFSKNDFDSIKVNVNFTEGSFIYSKKGAIRGIHYQTRYSQSKLIHVIKGSIYDVVVDLRPNSRTFGKHIEITLKENDNVFLYIPKGLGHGFQSISDSIFFYQSTGKYDPQSCNGINWLDQDLNIKWPLKECAIVSTKDANLQKLSDYMRNIKND